MRKLLLLLTGFLLLASCGESYEETKRVSRQNRLRLAREDSAALKIAVLPTLECLPLYVAKELMLFDTAVVYLKNSYLKAVILEGLSARRVGLEML